MIKHLIVILLVLLATSASAQQPDPAFMQRALGVLQAQRDQAMDAAVVSEAKSVGLADDLAKAQARIKELETKPEEKK